MAVLYQVPVVEKFYWQPAVHSRSLSSPPIGAAKGDRYIIGSAPSGVWSGHVYHVTYYDGSQWQFEIPGIGWQVWVEDETKYFYFTGTWNPVIPPTSKVRAYQSITQSPASGVWTKINLQSVTFDALSEFNTSLSRFTATYSGYYRIIGQVTFSSSRNVTLGLYINGVIASSMRQNSAFSANTVDMFLLTTGDYVELYCNSNAGVTVNSSTSTYLCLSRVI